MKVLISLFVISFSTSVLAADSSWLLCKGKVNLEGSIMNVVVNSVEHRAGIDDEGNDKSSNSNKLKIFFPVFQSRKSRFLYFLLTEFLVERKILYLLNFFFIQQTIF